MDLAFLSLSFCAVVIASLAIDLSPNGEPTDCKCTEIPPYNLTRLPPPTCHTFGDYYRYTCIEGYVRQVGTSNRIKCERRDDGGLWLKPSPPLKCIPDPKSPPATQKPRTLPTQDGGYGSPRKTTVESSRGGSSTSTSQDSSPDQTTGRTPTTQDSDYSFPRRTTADISRGGSSTSTSQDVSSDQTTGNEQKDNQIHDNEKDRGGITAVIVIIAILLLFALIGFVCYYYKKKEERNTCSLALRQERHNVQLNLLETTERV